MWVQLTADQAGAGPAAAAPHHRLLTAAQHLPLTSPTTHVVSPPISDFTSVFTQRNSFVPPNIRLDCEISFLAYPQFTLFSFIIYDEMQCFLDKLLLWSFNKHLNSALNPEFRPPAEDRLQAGR